MPQNHCHIDFLLNLSETHFKGGKCCITFDKAFLHFPCEFFKATLAYNDFQPGIK